MERKIYFEVDVFSYEVVREDGNSGVVICVFS